MSKKLNITYEPSGIYKWGLLFVLSLMLGQLIGINYIFKNVLNYLYSIPILLTIDITYQYFTGQLKIEYKETIK